MNHAKIYSGMTGRGTKEDNIINPDGTLSSLNPITQDQEKLELADSAAIKQIKLQWLQSSTTQQLLDILKNEKNRLMEEAVVNANQFAQNGNFQLAISRLVKVGQISETIKHIKEL